MTDLTGSRILLGLTGGVAAYKAAWLARLLVKGESDVRVVMTEAACGFITPATMQALTGQPVFTARLHRHVGSPRSRQHGPHRAVPGPRSDIDRSG
jgi:phosphopantothenoylcysteine synthetase/decarboxylase